MLRVLEHRGFRRIWLSQVVSQLGDWLNRMAVLTLIARLSGGPSAAVALGLLFATEFALRLAPTTVLATVAGPVADRLPRRALMIGADLARAAVVLGLCLVDEPGELPLLYVLLVVQMGIAPFFEAARSASVPNLVPPEQLVDAHALSAATWSAMLAFGSFAGGVAVTWLGPRGSFVLDAGTYLVSALLLRGLRLPPPPRQPQRLRLSDLVLMRDLRRALGHARGHGLGPVLAIKLTWGMAGGFLVMLSVLGAGRFAAHGEGVAIGLLYAARGVGTGLGPFLARRLLGHSDHALARAVAWSFVLAGCGYACVPVAGSLAVACVAVGVAHLGGSTIWVSSTVLWQRRVDDAYRGRVHSLDFLGMTFSFAAWGLAIGALYDATGSVDGALWVAAGAAAVAGPLWWRFGARRFLQEPNSGRSSASRASIE